MSRLPELKAWDPPPGQVILRCAFCRRLVVGEPTTHGERHEECGTGHLTTIAMVTRRMLADHETAALLHEVRSA